MSSSVYTVQTLASVQVYEFGQKLQEVDLNNSHFCTQALFSCSQNNLSNKTSQSDMDTETHCEMIRDLFSMQCTGTKWYTYQARVWRPKMGRGQDFKFMEDIKLKIPAQQKFLQKCT